MYDYKYICDFHGAAAIEMNENSLQEGMLIHRDEMTTHVRIMGTW